MKSLGSVTASSIHGGAKPQLTSLVDVLTVLLIFLIRSFSAEGSPVNPVSSVTLPVSSSLNPAKVMTSIELTPDQLQVNGGVIVSMSAIKESDSLFIPQLYSYLKKNRITDPQGEVMIQSDKNTEFEIVKKVMFTCSKAGATDFTILVVNEE
jgi:biopolymer transport protein ExbD